ncbi:hypothetical protein ABIE48_004506 [Paenibacillus sp. OAE614]
MGKRKETRIPDSAVQAKTGTGFQDDGNKTVYGSFRYGCYVTNNRD